MHGIQEREYRMEELRNCPFCGGDELYIRAFSIGPECFIRCGICGAMIEKEVKWNGMSREEHDAECAKVLIEAWNTRKPMERIVERLEDILDTKHKLSLREDRDEIRYFYEMQMLKEAIEIVKEEMT